MLNDFLVFLFSFITFILGSWAGVLWFRNKGLDDEVKKLKHEKWAKELEAIHNYYSSADLQSQVDRANAEWKSRNNNESGG